MAPGIRFAYMDGMRAIAALAVLATHAFIFAGATGADAALGRFTSRLEVGVTIFFVISGFLLYRPFVAARAGGTAAPRPSAYAWRRFLRIAPAYWLALAVSALWLAKPEVFTPDGVVTYFGFAQTLRESTIGGGLAQAWSLCVEVAFYAFLPVWALAMRSLPRGPGWLRTELVGLAVLVVVAAVWKGAVLAAGDPAQVRITPMLIALPAHLDVFAIGMALAVASVAWQERGRLPGPARVLERAPWLSWLVAAAAFWAVSTQIGIGERIFEPYTVGDYLQRHYLYCLIAAAMVVPAVIGGGGWVRGLLGHPVMAWLGLVSYGIFLWHFTVLALAERWGLGGAEPVHPYLVWPAVAAAGAVALAAVSWYAIERPALRLKRAVSERPREELAHAMQG